MSNTVVRVLMIVFGNKTLQKIVVGLFAEWAESTGTKVDDWMVTGIARMLDITLGDPEKGIPPEPIPDDNLFLGEADLAAIKEDRYIAKKLVTDHSIRNCRIPSIPLDFGSGLG